MANIVEFRDVCKHYGEGLTATEVLKHASFALKEGQSMAIVGPSGSGKTTLLQIAGLLDTCSSGSVLIDGINYSGKKEGEMTVARRRYIGFIYQAHCLLSEMTALENVMLPRLIMRVNADVAAKEASLILDSLGITGAKQTRRPHELSSGESQRVAVARAFVAQPRLILADEPTGNLDSHNAHLVFNLILDLCKQHRVSALVITHNESLARQLDRVMTIKNKAIVESCSESI